MASQTTKSVFAGAGQQFLKAREEYKGAEANYGNPSLPPGIEGGIAELRDLHFGEYKDGPYKGQPFFMGAGVVIEPENHEGIRCSGMRTQIGPEPLCDTPERGGETSRKTWGEHYGWFRNQLLILGLDIDQFTGTPEQIEEQIRAGMAALVDQKLHFRFRTWKGQPTPEFKNPRVQHQWNGLYTPEANGELLPNNPAAGTVDSSPSQQPDPNPEGFPEEVDLDALAEQAGDVAGGQEARDKLAAIAASVGMTTEEIDGAESWESLVVSIRERQEGDSEAPGEPEPEPDPAKGDVMYVQFNDPKTKKPAIDKNKKPKYTDVQVQSYDAKKEEASVKRLDTKVIVKVKKDALLRAKP